MHDWLVYELTRPESILALPVSMNCNKGFEKTLEVEDVEAQRSSGTSGSWVFPLINQEGNPWIGFRQMLDCCHLQKGDFLSLKGENKQVLAAYWSVSLLGSTQESYSSRFQLATYLL